MSRGWRPALRIARRTVRRNLGRSLLIAVLVGVPVAGATIVDGLYRTLNDPARRTYSALGEADGTAQVTTLERLPADYRPKPYAWYGDDSGPGRDPADVDLAAMLPAGTEIVPDAVEYPLRLDVGDGTARMRLTVTALGERLTTHQARLAAGRLPQGQDEVLLTQPLAERLGLLDDGDLTAGAQISVHDGPTVIVTGIAILPFCLNCENVVGRPGSTVAKAVEDPEATAYGPTGPPGQSYLVDLPANVDADALWPELAEQGVAFTPRDAYVHPERYEDDVEPGPDSVEALQAVALVMLIVGLGLLEVVLLAGAAFAVGARRQVRELGLVAVSGGTADQIRRIVLAQGLVLGAIGAVLGIVIGGLIVVLGQPVWQNLANELVEGWQFGAVEIAVAAGVGLLSGLAAAVVPAVGAAQMRPVDALAGRFRSGKIAARLPAVGLLLIGAGLLIAFVGNRVIADDFAAYAERLEAAEGTGVWVEPLPLPAAPVALQLIGGMLAIAGLVIVIPGLVTLIAKAGRRLPLSARYAVRDAARHRHRTAPAAAAIMIVVAASISLAFAVAGVERAAPLQFLPLLPPNTVEVSSNATISDLKGETSTDLVSGAAQAVASALPDGTITEISTAVFDAASIQLPGEVPAVETSVYVSPPKSYFDDCDDCPFFGNGQLTLVTPELFELTTGHPMDAATREALAAGKVVVFDPAFVDADGMTVYHEPQGTEKRFLAHVIEPGEQFYHSLPQAFISAQTAEAQGWQTLTTRALVTHGKGTAEQIDAAFDAAEANDAYVQLDQPPSDAPVVFIALAAGSAFVTLVGVAIVVALAAVEGRADLATLAAVGAQPRRRRALAGAQAMVVGGLGTALGLVLGVYIAFTAWPTTGSPEFLVPWQNLLITGFGVPLLAVLVAMAVTPSRLPLVRRLE